jgi:hypothetical protein
MVPPEMVTAIFYNFAPERVAKALPAAWQIAGPEAALRARQESAVAALRRYGISADENVTVAAELAGKAARQAPLEGRPLFAANRALPWPDDPLAALWHAATLLREQRGDTHIAYWPRPVSPAGNATCCRPRRARFLGTTSPAPATTTRRHCVITNNSWPSAGC